MTTLSSKDFFGGQSGQVVAPTPQPTAQDPSFVSAIKSDVVERADRVGAILNRSDSSLPEKAVQVFGQGAGAAANLAEQSVMRVPGAKTVADGVGAGISWLSTSDLSPIKHLGDVIGSSKVLQTAVNLYDTDKNFKDTIDAVANVVRLGGDVSTAVNSADFATNITNKVIRSVKDTAATAVDAVGAKIVDKSASAPADIMNRVARIKPTDYSAFEKMSGKTPGQYLVETGNFGSPEKIIAKEAEKFTNSVNTVDTELAKLPGVYKGGAIKDALSALLEKAKRVSSDNVQSPYLDETRGLVAKYNDKGLSMEEVNRVKRLYERNVKLGYNKLTNADQVEQATNIDNALRTWQVGKAKELGFKNISELNKQTQISKFIVNKLGEQIIGQSGLNGVNLTDWVVLSGGNPQAVAGFLTKKFFSSKAVQAKVAELLNKEGIQVPVGADVSATVENILRHAFPQGAGLELPPGGSGAKVQGLDPIPMRPAATTENMAQSVTRETINPKTGDRYVKDQKTGKTVIIPSKRAKQRTLKK